LKKVPGRENTLGCIYWGPFLAWGYMLGKSLGVQQWGFLAPHMKDFDDFQRVGDNGIQAITVTLETMGISIRPKLP